MGFEIFTSKLEYFCIKIATKNWRLFKLKTSYQLFLFKMDKTDLFNITHTQVKCTRITSIKSFITSQFSNSF